MVYSFFFLFSFFLFPLHPGSCGIPVCDDDNEEDIKGASLINRQSVSGEEGVLLAGTSVFVLNPGQTPCKYRTSILFISPASCFYSPLPPPPPIPTTDYVIKPAYLNF